MELIKRENIISIFEKYKNFLTQIQRQAIQLYYYEDLSLRELADIMATSRSAAYDAVKKGEKKLKSIEEKMK